VVSLKGVTVAFGADKVLDELTLELTEPGAYLILGANGSGKTVLLDVIGGRRRPDKGEVLLGSVPVYGLFGPDLPRIEYLQREAVPEESDALWNLFAYQAKQGSGQAKPREIVQRFHLPWSEEQMRRLRLDMLSQSEVLEFELLCAFAVRPDYLLVDDYLSRFSFDTCERTIGNLRAWQKVSTGTAILTSSRFFGHMDGFAGVYHLTGGKLAELPPTPPVGSAESGTGREVLVVCGEYFYRHSRAQEENEHLAVKTVLENALLIEIKTTLDGALAYLQSLGIDLVAVVLSPDAEGYEYCHQRFF
jgi:ABC-type multidrug transport system ATPase subunit